MTSNTSASAERQLERRAKHRLAVLRHVEEVSGNVAATCRYYGISRQAYYGWLKRYESEGFEGLKDRSSAPHHSPDRDQRGGDREDPLAAPAISFRPAEDRHVFEALPRPHHQLRQGFGGS